MMRGLASLALYLLVVGAGAAEIRTLDFTRDGDIYRVASDVYMAAPPGGVYAVLIDYENLDRLSSAFLETRFIEPIEDGRGLVYLHMEACILFFCRDVKLTEEIRVVPETRVEVTILPAQSDLNYGRSSWDIAAVDDGSLVHYELEMQPSFWIPPIIGPMIMKAVARRKGLRAARRVEALAAGEPMPSELLIERPASQ
jgi:hypothetical protein